MGLIDIIKKWIGGLPVVDRDKCIEIVSKAIIEADSDKSGTISISELIQAIKRIARDLKA